MLMGLLPQENKMSVMNVVLTRTNLSNEPIKSKERLIFQCGPRRFIVNPIFSQHTNGNKHKVFVIVITSYSVFVITMQFISSILELGDSNFLAI